MTGAGAPISATAASRHADASFFDPELLRQFGITRVGDVTGLDIIGIPVWFAVRPNSRGLSVSQGKGLVAEQARLSAIMEAVEGAVAEDTRKHVSAFGSLEQMRVKGIPLIPFETVGRVDPDRLDPRRERGWVKGISVRRQQEVFAPYELIGMDFRADFPWDRQAFLMSSQGLAAGFNHDQAVLHALLELVENDACFLVDTFETRTIAPEPVTFPAGVDTAFDSLVDRLSEIDLTPSFFDMTNTLGVPVVMASLPRSVNALDGPATRNAAGAACRPATYDAAVAALLEAIQSRLTDISGARDDLSPLRYQRDMLSAPASARQPVERTPVQLDLVTDDGFLPPWRQLAERLFTAGIEDIYVFALESGVPGLNVVRVLASGLTPTSGGLQNISPRTLDHFLSAGGLR